LRNAVHDVDSLHSELVLEPGNELDAFKAAVDYVGHFFGMDNLGLQGFGEELVAIAAPALGAIEGDIGIDEQALATDRGPTVGGDADADPEATLMALIADRLAHLLDDALGKGAKMLVILAGAGQQHEFVAADAGNKITGAAIGTQDRAGMDQH